MNNLNFKDYFYYDETSPSCLRWKVDRHCGRGRYLVSAGDIAGSLQHGRYYSVRLYRSAYQAHRVIWEMMRGSLNDLVIDHIDGCRTNNRLDNLRPVEIRANTRNSCLRSFNTSGATGVSIHTAPSGLKYWRAFWFDLGSKVKSKYFSFDKLGEREAFRQACIARSNAIRELNLLGAGYTERHGLALIKKEAVLND